MRTASRVRDPTPVHPAGAAVPFIHRESEKASSRKPGREGSARLRPVASFRRSSTGRGGMFFACGMQKRRLLVLVVTTLATLLVSGCGGGDGASQEDDSDEDTTTTTEDTEQATTTADSGQAPEDALNAALDQS